MAPIYSTLLVDGPFALGFAGVVYTVPAGATVVVTDMDTALRNTGSGPVSYVTLGASLMLIHTAQGAELINQQWRGRQVLNAGGTISFTTQAANSYLRITGYLLRP